MKTKVEIWKLAIAMLSTAMFAACSESSLEPIVETTMDEVEFDVAVKQVDTVSVSLSHTRSANQRMGLPTGCFEMSDDGITIYANQLAVGMIDAHNNVSSARARGTEKTSADFYSSFGLYGYFYGETETWSNTMTPIINEEITQTSGSWKATKAWPGGSKATFFAWAPYSATGLTASSSSTPSITYTVASTASSQQDILVCKTAELSSSKTPIALDFKHAMTAVRFVVGNIGYFTEIKSIKIEGVSDQGTLEIGASTWTNQSGSASYEITGSFNIATLGESIIGGELMFLMPQTLPAGAKLTVVMENGTNEKTFSANLAGTNWPMGNTVTYKLSVQKIEGDYKFEVTPSTESLDESGGTVSYTVKSRYEYSDGTTIDIPWTASYSLDGEAEETSANSTVTVFTSSGTAGSSDISMTLAPETSRYFSTTSSNTHTATLRGKEMVGSSSSPKNLAGSDDSETTANCYVIDAPGYYKFPVVYGNGLVNGLKNTKSITGAAPYVNHLGSPVTQAYLKDNASVTPAEALIVWQDAYHLVSPSSVKLSADLKYISFYVPKDYICQGNCVIAVRDASRTIMWSWHIWVTDLDTTTPVTNSTNNISYFPAALGHCDEEERGLLPHSVKVTLKQNTSNKTATFTVSQTPTLSTTQIMNWNCTYYQWGRKDPQRPLFDKSSVKQIYDNDEYQYLSFDDGLVKGYATIAEAIQNPNKRYYTYRKAWYSASQKVNLWTDNFKTIYDPSPVGYKVPKSTDLEKITIKGSGGTWNSGLTYDGSFWPAYGNLWNETLPIRQYKEDMDYYSSTCYSENLAYYIEIAVPRNISRFVKSDIQNAASIRPFKE